VRALDRTREGRELLLTAPRPAMCFGTARGITPEGTLHLDARANDAAGAAYAAHLLLHRAENVPPSPPTDRAACLRAQEAEARAAALEARLSLELGVFPRAADHVVRCDDAR
jgi:hypothetical protein